MSKLVATNIRLPKDELIFYRQLALQKGISFSSFLRKILTQYRHQVMVKGKVELKKIAVAKKRENEAIWKLKPFSFSKKTWKKKEDKYIYEAK